MTSQTLRCPECDAAIPAENINIQEMMAVCHSCNAVFSFASKAQHIKYKRRKFKQPEGLILDESRDILDISFPRRKGRDDLQGAAILTFLTLFLTLIMTVLLIEEGPHPVMFLFGLPWFVFFTTLVAVLVNKSRLVLDGYSVTVDSRPLPVILPGEDWLYAEKSLPRDEIVRVYPEQTEDSRKAGGMNRYYHVCAELPDGERVIMLKALPQNHAFYIAQEINAYLAETDVDDIIPTALIDADDSAMFDLDALIDGDDAELIFEEGELKQASD